jgi:hypothetical protein
MNPQHDWLTILQQHVERGDAEFDLRQVEPGDMLRVVTQHTRYDLVFLSDREADLKTDRPNRPEGKVKIMGCTFGMSSSIKPDFLFCGGNLEFTFDDGAMTHLTTAIREIHWLRKRLNPPGNPE